MTETRAIIIAALVAIALLSIVLGIGRPWLTRVAAAGMAVLGSLWLLSPLAVLAGRRWLDHCWPNCSLTQELVGMTFVFALPLVAAISIVLAVARAFGNIRAS